MEANELVKNKVGEVRTAVSIELRRRDSFKERLDALDVELLESRARLEKLHDQHSQVKQQHVDAVLNGKASDSEIFSQMTALQGAIDELKSRIELNEGEARPALEKALEQADSALADSLKSKLPPVIAELEQLMVDVFNNAFDFSSAWDRDLGSLLGELGIHENVLKAGTLGVTLKPTCPRLVELFNQYANA